MLKQNEYLSELHIMLFMTNAVSKFLSSNLNNSFTAENCPSKGKNQYVNTEKNGKLLSIEKVLIYTSAPSICNSVSSCNLSLTPLFSKISCHAGFASSHSCLLYTSDAADE